jgi:hypothetical protein
MSRTIISWGLIFASFLFLQEVEAKRFTSQYCEFELPSGWECALEGTEWVCQSSNKARQKEAIIILAAKIRGQQDSLDQYQSYLKEQKNFVLPGGKRQVSEAKYTKLSTINGHRWVDALHLASEVPGFYTRYLATVKEDLGVAVTFSVSKEHYGNYQQIFDRVVATLRVFRSRNAGGGNYKISKKDDDLLDDTNFIPDGDKSFDISNNKRRGGRAGVTPIEILIYFLLGGGAIAIYLKMKGGKKKKKKKKKKD